jgi:hypothetical protein
VISKATQPESDAYSGATVLDARAAGLEVVVLDDAIRALDAQPGDGEHALAEMKASGAHISPASRLPGTQVPGGDVEGRSPQAH